MHGPLDPNLNKMKKLKNTMRHQENTTTWIFNYITGIMFNDLKSDNFIVVLVFKVPVIRNTFATFMKAIVSGML